MLCPLSYGGTRAGAGMAKNLANNSFRDVDLGRKSRRTAWQASL